jgi:AcrR family transcriptional regulator
MSSRRILSPEKILAAALAIADAEGVDALSMRRIARDLGVQAMSLYNHIANRDEIIDALVEVVIDEMGAPDLTLPWIEAIRRQARASHEVLLRHPWAAMMIMSRMNVGAARFRFVDRMIGCFVHAGFTLPEADHATNLVDSFVYGYTLQEITFPLAEGTYREVAAAYLDQIPEDRYPFLHRMAGAVIDGSYSGVHDFAFGLELILSGLAALPTGGHPLR